MGVIKRSGVRPITPEEYRQKVNEIEDYFVELTVGLVRVEPEGTSDFYRIMKRLGVKMEIPQTMQIEYDSQGKPVPGKMVEMKYDNDQMLEKIDEITMIRACGITRDPKIHEPPAPGVERNPEFLYWDELHPIDRRTLTEALKSPELSAAGATFRSE